MSDLTPLRELPLETLYIIECPAITNVQPLAEITTLRDVQIPTWSRNLESLRALPKLGWIGFTSGPSKPAEEFWTEWDKQKAEPN